jgi:hypothetical protein
MRHNKDQVKYFRHGNKYGNAVSAADTALKKTVFTNGSFFVNTGLMMAF